MARPFTLEGMARSEGYQAKVAGFKLVVALAAILVAMAVSFTFRSTAVVGIGSAIVGLVAIGACICYGREVRYHLVMMRHYQQAHAQNVRRGPKPPRVIGQPHHRPYR